MSSDGPETRARGGGPAPTPGSPEFEEYLDEQGQEAMDEALAHPITRVFMACLAVAGFWIFAEIFWSEVFGDDPLWRRILAAVGVPAVFIPFLIDIGGVALFGRSRTPWYRAIMRAYEPWRFRGSQSPPERDGEVESPTRTEKT